jgi:hypothetical protein
VSDPDEPQPAGVPERHDGARLLAGAWILATRVPSQRGGKPFAQRNFLFGRNIGKPVDRASESVEGWDRSGKCTPLLRGQRGEGCVED